MIDILKAIFLGIVQGLTEYLPVSSSGHLQFIGDLMQADFDKGTGAFDLMLHVGTLIPLFFIFYKDIINLFKAPYKDFMYLFFASIPAVIVMGAFKVLDIAIPGKMLCFLFLITAAVLYITEVRAKNVRTIKEFDGKSAMIMGFAQAFAVLPGISRSGMTICSGVLNGNDREKVAKFSFFMSMVAILGASTLQLAQMVYQDNFVLDLWPTICGMAAAAISGFFAIKLLLFVIKKANYKWFSVYLIVISIVSFCYYFLIR